MEPTIGLEPMTCRFESAALPTELRRPRFILPHLIVDLTAPEHLVDGSN
jgi:hypothetical protein